jgi:cell wall-associated NlpC family hydrolase
MKKIFALMLAPVLLLFILVAATPDQAPNPAPEQTPVHFASSLSEPPIDKAVTKTKKTDVAKKEKRAADRDWYNAAESNSTEAMIEYALSLIGSPYVYGGTNSNGFDCSGFTSHVFEENGTPITRSSTTQSQDGISVDREDARPGDLVIFTGTNLNVREPGHVGIVISQPGDTISFVHSSSNGGVKISQVEGTRYNERFLDIRRVL